METYYLVDYENVHHYGLAGAEPLTANDHIIIFFTSACRTIDFAQLSSLGQASFSTIEAPPGDQSADVHIDTYLGYLIGKSKEICRIVVISKDKGYDKILTFWAEKNMAYTNRAASIGEDVKYRERYCITEDGYRKSRIKEYRNFVDIFSYEEDRTTDKAEEKITATKPAATALSGSDFCNINHRIICGLAKVNTVNSGMVASATIKALKKNPKMDKVTTVVRNQFGAKKYEKIGPVIINVLGDYIS